jgi:hypothetical protein
LHLKEHCGGHRGVGEEAFAVGVGRRLCGTRSNVGGACNRPTGTCGKGGHSIGTTRGAGGLIAHAARAIQVAQSSDREISRMLDLLVDGGLRLQRAEILEKLIRARLRLVTLAQGIGVLPFGLHRVTAGVLAMRAIGEDGAGDRDDGRHNRKDSDGQALRDEGIEDHAASFHSG